MVVVGTGVPRNGVVLSLEESSASAGSAGKPARFGWSGPVANIFRSLSRTVTEVSLGNRYLNSEVIPMPTILLHTASALSALGSDEPNMGTS